MDFSEFIEQQENDYRDPDEYWNQVGEMEADQERDLSEDESESEK